MRAARIITPARSGGGFHALCTALQSEVWTDATVTIGGDLPVHTADLVAVSMGTERSENFGIGCLMALGRDNALQAFAIFTTIGGMRKFAAAGLPARLGDRVKFAVIAGLEPTPTGWPREIKVIRVASPPTGTDTALVAAEFRRFIEAPRPSIDLEEPVQRQHRAAHG